MTKTRLVALAAILAWGAPCELAQSAPSTITLDAIARGWYREPGLWQEGNSNYFVGNRQGVGEFRNYFAFDASGVTAPVIGAELRLRNPVSGFVSNERFETYVLFDVATPIDTLMLGGDPVATFADLASGPSYGSHSASPADNGTVVQIPLNAAAIGALNAANAAFPVGGAMSTLSGTADQYLFGMTNEGHLPTTQLVLTVVAEPSSPLVAAVGLATVGGLRRRRAAALQR